jgi:hypothetical protein
LRTRDEIHDIIVEYRDNHARMSDLSRVYGMTRQGIYKLLHAHGIDTGKGQRIKVPCQVCGAVMLKHRSRARMKQHFFCSDECLWAWKKVKTESYRPDNYHSRMGVKIVTALFPEFNHAIHSLHYIDGDREHNNKKNLEVYATEKEHLRRHLKEEIEPIWRGICL